MMYAGESRLAYRRSNTLRRSFRRTETKSGVVSGESQKMSAEGVRIEIQISQAKGQSKKRMISSVIWRYAGFRSTVLPGSRLFYFPKEGVF